MKFFKPGVINGWEPIKLARALSGGEAIFKDGKVVGIQITTGEISDSEKWRRSSEQAASLLEFQNKFIGIAAVGINILNKDGSVTSARVTLWNGAAQLISRYSHEEVIRHMTISARNIDSLRRRS